MPRGNPNPVGAFKPGHSKVGGRKTGGKNKKTVEREIVQQYQAATVAGKPPVMLGKDILSDMANYFYRRMGHYQPGAKNPNTGEKTEDPKMFLDMATMARDCAAAVAKFESPTFRAQQVFQTPLPVEQPKAIGRDNVIAIDDPDALMRVYKSRIAGVR